jgi:hypothetical protein
MSSLAEVIAAVEPELAAYAVEELPDDRFGAAVPDPVRLFVLEAVYEGYLLHYGKSRLFEGMDPDLRLLAGDSLYALGLARLAAGGDLPAVVELADLISESARAHAENRSETVEALWDASAAVLGLAAR